MTVRFLADEDLRAAIIEGLRSREPAIDIVDVKTSDLRKTADPELLELAAQQGRILITHDRKTMTRHFRDRLDAGKPNPGIFVVPQQPSSVGEVIDSLLLVWAASEPEDWRNRVVYLPFR